LRYVRTIEHHEVPSSSWSPETQAERSAIREQVERILANPLFKNSKRYPSLLRYVVEHTLEGEAAKLKERTLGVEVFGRDPHYDTNLDPVVRTTAGEIRKRIAQYYHEPGHEAELRIDLPSGSYVPEFHLPPLGKPVSVAHPKPRHARLVYWLAAATLAGLFLVAAWFKPWASHALDQFWSPLFNSSNPVLLCIAPANGSSDSVAQAPPADQNTLTLREVQHLESQHVALSDATTLSRLAGLLQSRGKPYHIRNAVLTSFRDLRDGPVVLIGAFNNDWTLRLTSQLRYSFGRDNDIHLWWVNDRQNPGRRDWTISMAEPTAKVNEDYAIISRIMDPTTEQPIVVAAGIGIYGTMAAGEFLADNNHLAALAHRAPADWARKNVQVVVATKVINGVSGPPRIVATYFW
jgi:hypothetical protein